jgi:hypothetical protein
MKEYTFSGILANCNNHISLFKQCLLEIILAETNKEFAEAHLECKFCSYVKLMKMF